jgi:F0F1-type ATP synthase beta subunit
MKGTVKTIIGPVVDIEFTDHIPEIYNAIETEIDGKRVVLETQYHLGNNVIRTIAMDSTDGMYRGMEVTDTGAPISVPVGTDTLGRIFNGLSNGGVNIDATGGTGTLTYDWSNDGAESPDNDLQDLSGVVAGTYTVTVSDANACTASASYTITEPAILSASATKVDVLCNGAST